MATLESTAAETLVEAPAPAGRRPSRSRASARPTGRWSRWTTFSFTVTEGEIFGILGPNGAGKTTAIECAIGLRRPDAGTIRLLGLDPHADQDQVHEIVGVQLQSGALPAKLRVGEILEEYRSFYRDPADVDGFSTRRRWSSHFTRAAQPYIRLLQTAFAAGQAAACVVRGRDRRPGRPPWAASRRSASIRAGVRAAYSRQARTAWTSSPARLSFRSCRMWLTT